MLFNQIGLRIAHKCDFQFISEYISELNFAYYFTVLSTLGKIRKKFKVYVCYAFGPQCSSFKFFFPFTLINDVFNMVTSLNWTLLHFFLQKIYVIRACQIFLVISHQEYLQLRGTLPWKLMKMKKTARVLMLQHPQ
jgi:hypothetical protein